MAGRLRLLLPRRLIAAALVPLLTAAGVAAALLWDGPAAGDSAGVGAPAIPPAQQAPVEDLVARGQELYQVGCVSCHGVGGRGVEERGPTLEEAGPASVDFYLSSGRMPAASGAGQPGRKEPVYDDDQRAALVAYVSTLGEGPAIPTVDPARGDLPLGQQLYTANCAACHNSAGSGGALGQAVYAPALQPATALQVAEAVRVGPGAMPGFNEQQLDQHQLDSVVRYVTHLQDPQDRGGFALGRVGPVPEGLVAWVVGLGLIILAIRWIGTADPVTLDPHGQDTGTGTGTDTGTGTGTGTKSGTGTGTKSGTGTGMGIDDDSQDEQGSSP